jgi:GDP-mannose 6-dehydrogenase
MRVSVFGIGYVGAVVGGCMARQGHAVIAVDVQRIKVDAINAGRSPISEPGLGDIIAEARRAGRLEATQDAARAIDRSDVSLICVGTPGLRNGKLDMTYVVGVATEIGRLIGAKARKGAPRHTIVLRSTLLPGLLETIVAPALERASGLGAGMDFGLGYLPEFLREGHGVDDFERPTIAVIAAWDQQTMALLRGLNEGNGALIHECPIRAAEAIKSVSNAWHAVKISFSNEIGAICRAGGIDGRAVMEVLCTDTKLNVSKAYMKPGFAFGGSCLPKDLKALLHHAHAGDVDTRMLDAALAVNELHIGRALDLIAASGRRKIALLGLTFKPQTDDLRDSPLVELAERLVGKGYALRIYDPSFSYDALIGHNRDFIMTALPHLSSILVETLDEALHHGETIVVGHDSPAYAELPAKLRASHHVIDLAGGATSLLGRKEYSGICW